MGRDTVVTVLRHPSLWATGVVQLFALSPRGWWRRFPPLPRPDRQYYRWRLQTQYGDADHEPVAADVVAYLKWCKSERRALR
ncbi:MAG TPA: hypothetical protein VFB78_14800 [Acidimicrobiales bacterium]|nr:hypothetical protein [Acidimicrobiales bacterium]